MTPPALQPPPLPPPPFASVVAMPPTVADVRPTSVRVLSIVGIVFGASSILQALLTAVQYVTWRLQPAFAAATAPPAFDLPSQLFGELLPWTVAMNVVQVAFGAVLVVLSVHAWQLRESGRRGMLVYSGVSIASSFVMGALSAAIIMPRMLAPLAQPPLAFAPETVQALAVAFSVLMSLVSMVLPAFVLVLFRRPDVVAAFASAEAGRAGGRG